MDDFFTEQGGAPPDPALSSGGDDFFGGDAPAPAPDGPRPLDDAFGGDTGVGGSPPGEFAASMGAMGDDFGDMGGGGGGGGGMPTQDMGGSLASDMGNMDMGGNDMGNDMGMGDMGMPAPPSDQSLSEQFSEQPAMAVPAQMPANGNNGNGNGNGGGAMDAQAFGSDALAEWRAAHQKAIAEKEADEEREVQSIREVGPCRLTPGFRSRPHARFQGLSALETEI